MCIRDRLNPKSKTSFRCAKLRKNPETKVLRFLALYPLIWPFQTLSRISNDGVWRDLSFDMKNSWFHALWLGIQPFLCLNPWKSMELHGNPWKSMEIHGNPCRSTRSTLHNLICYRMSVSRASGTPCGSVFGRFSVFVMRPSHVCLVHGACARVLCASLVRRLVRQKQTFLQNTVRFCVLLYSADYVPLIFNDFCWFPNI